MKHAKSTTRFELTKKIFEYIFMYKSLFLFNFFFSITSTTLSISLPLFLNQYIKAINIGSSNNSSVFIVTLIFFISAGLWQALSLAFNTYLSQALRKRFLKLVFEKINVISLSYYDMHKNADILSRISYDADGFCGSIQSFFNNAICLPIYLIALVGTLWYFCWYIGVAILVIFILYSVIAIFLGKKTYNYHFSLSKLNSEMLSQINETIPNLQVMVSYNIIPKTLDNFKHTSSNNMITSFKANTFSNIIWGIEFFTANLILLVILVLTAVFISANPSQLSLIAPMILMTGFIYKPAQDIAAFAISIPNTYVQCKRVTSFLEEKEEHENFATSDLNEIKGNIEFKNVYFSYDNKTDVLRDITFKINSKQKIGIVGRTGSGKTSITNLLLRFYEKKSGEILFDGNPIENYSIHQIREQIGLILQDSWLFHGTIMENLLYNSSGVTKSEVVDICKKIQIHDCIMGLPGGYDYTVNDESNISFGQKQLLSIARVLIKKSNIVIMDEATSNIDAETEAQIKNALDKMFKESTCLVVAHRLSTIKNYDLIIVIDNGEIKEIGKHDQLMKNRNAYYKMYNAQFNIVKS